MNAFSLTKYLCCFLDGQHSKHSAEFLVVLILLFWPSFQNKCQKLQTTEAVFSLLLRGMTFSFIAGDGTFLCKILQNIHKNSRSRGFCSSSLQNEMGSTRIHFKSFFKSLSLKVIFGKIKSYSLFQSIIHFFCELNPRWIKILQKSLIPQPY